MCNNNVAAAGAGAGSWLIKEYIQQEGDKTEVTDPFIWILIIY